MREHILHSYAWNTVMTLASVANVVFAWPQIHKAWKTGQTGDISLLALGLLLFVQASFTTQGFLTGDKFFAWSGLASGMSTAVLLCSTLYLRKRARLFSAIL